jgi:hypothetical protein
MNGERRGTAYSVLLLRTLKKKDLKFAGFATFLSLKLEDRERKCLNLSADQKMVSSTCEQTDD